MGLTTIHGISPLFCDWEPFVRSDGAYFLQTQFAVKAQKPSLGRRNHLQWVLPTSDCQDRKIERSALSENLDLLASGWCVTRLVSESFNFCEV